MSKWLLLTIPLILCACGDGRVETEAGVSPPAATGTNDEPSKEVSKVVAPSRDQPAAGIADTDRDEESAGAMPAAVYRPPDFRPQHNVDELAEMGIARVESRRLILYSDLPRDEIARLPGLVDQLYQEWVAYFGALPPDRTGEEYQITGYLMRDEDLFRRAGLITDYLPYFEHGRNQGRRFWMREQPYQFYQEHLLLHEATHCFMTTLTNSYGPAWYMEGMAEYFALHRPTESGDVVFGVVPPPPGQMLGFDRIRVIREAIAAGGFMNLDEIAAFQSGDFLETRPYAWSWAACLFFNKSPRYSKRFRALGDPALRKRFRKALGKAFAEDADTLPVEWAYFANEITPNYDFQRMSLNFPPGTALSEGASQTVSVAADRGWQPVRIRLVAGQQYEVKATGEAILATAPRPWRSDPSGITFDYAHGAPLGLLQAAILVDDRSQSPDAAGGLLSPIDLGESGEIAPAVTGRLYLRINDHPYGLSDNSGEYQVVVGEVGLAEPGVDSG